jgi:hypothetical protein
MYIQPSEYGCAYSHVRVWRDIVEKGHPYALVFEDDSRLVPDFVLKMNSILEEAKDLKWDAINLGPILPIVKKQVSHSLFEGQSLGTHAYIISLECAKKMSHFDPELMKVGIDFQINRLPIIYLAVIDPLAIQESISSDPLTGVLTSWVNGDIGLSRTVDFTYFFRLGFQRLKHILILLIVVYLLYLLTK